MWWLELCLAAWWAWQPEGTAAVPQEPASGIARLQLLSERGAAPAPTAPAPAAPVTATTEAAPPATCLRIGPFADAAAAQAAATALQPLATGLRARERRATHAAESMPGDANNTRSVRTAPQAPPSPLSAAALPHSHAA